MSDDPKPMLKGYSAAYRMKLESEFFDSEHGSRNERIPMWMREPISRMLKEIENSRAALASQSEADQRTQVAPDTFINVAKKRPDAVGVPPHGR